MDPSAIALLPPEYNQASTYLKKTLDTHPLQVAGEDGQQVLTDAAVTVSRGSVLNLQKSDASRDLIGVELKSPSLINPKTADAVSAGMLSTLNDIQAVRNEVILVPQKEYVEGIKKRLGNLLQKAREAKIPGSDYDFTQSTVLNSEYSGHQVPDNAIQFIDEPNKTTIRVNIPTNPDNLKEAVERAEKVAADLNKRLPEIKENMVNHLIRKGYIPNLDEAAIKHLREHEFEVKVQQQGNWTSVFIGISSPEQQLAAKNPGEKTMEPEALNKTNMMQQIVDPIGADGKQKKDSRFKLATRSILYQGENLKTPSAIFNDVAGVMDVDSAVGKILFHLALAKPDLVPEIDALRKENVFKRRQQWNLPPDQQEEYKRTISGRIDPDDPTTMKFTFSVPKGKADEIVQAIAALGNNVTATVATEAPAVSATPATDEQAVTQTPANRIQAILDKGPTNPASLAATSPQAVNTAMEENPDKFKQLLANQATKQTAGPSPNPN